MIFAVFDPSPLTVCINCSFFTFITNNDSLRDFRVSSCVGPTTVISSCCTTFAHAFEKASGCTLQLCFKWSLRSEKSRRKEWRRRDETGIGNGPAIVTSERNSAPQLKRFNH